VALCAGDEITVEDLSDRLWATHSPGQRSSPLLVTTPREHDAVTLAQTKEEAEMTRITEALQKHRNNRLRAAAELGISRWTLYKKLHKYGLMNLAEKLTAT
jgi:DNA-binding NtrC family response regulator